MVRLDLLSPLKIMSKGYSLVYNSSDMIVRNADDLCKGDHVRIRLEHGGADAEITEIFPERM